MVYNNVNVNVLCVFSRNWTSILAPSPLCSSFTPSCLQKSADLVWLLDFECPVAIVSYIWDLMFTFAKSETDWNDSLTFQIHCCCDKVKHIELTSSSESSKCQCDFCILLDLAFSGFCEITPSVVGHLWTHHLNFNIPWIFFLLSPITSIWVILHLR